MKPLALAVALAACGPAAPTPAKPMPVSASADDPTCPLVVPGTSVSVEDTATGAALVFVTTGDVAEVRKRAAALAKLHDEHGTGDRMGAMIESPAPATASDVEGGSRIVFAAATPDDTAKLQQELHMHAQHLSSGSCKMAM